MSTIDANKPCDIDTSVPLRCRLAPSPSGRLHAGNIYAALFSWLFARITSGKVVLRIEDIDTARCKPAFAEQLIRDFELLGIDWDEGPMYQSKRTRFYADAFSTLENKGLIYPCFCSRADLNAARAPHGTPRNIYPGTCRNLTSQEILFASKRKSPSYRLRVASYDMCIEDLIQGKYFHNLAFDSGDFILKRSDGGFSYQLAVVVDDALMDVNCVVRGNDLLPSAPKQRYLQDCLGLPHVYYAHVPLIMASEDRRLSKRDNDASLDALLEKYRFPEALIGHIAYLAGLIDTEEALSPFELLMECSFEDLCHCFPAKGHIHWK